MDTDMKPYGLILSAGASRRMGTPKALLRWAGTPLVQRILDDFEEHCQKVIVVGGAHFEHLRRVLRPEQLVYAQNWRNGMRSSLRTGLQHLPKGPVLMTHVDRPGITRCTLESLVTAHGRRPMVPVYKGRMGHPIIIPQYLRKRLMESDNVPLRTLISQAGYDRIETHDPAVIRNINQRVDWARLRASQKPF